MPLPRRTFLRTGLAAALGAALAVPRLRAAPARRPRILVRSGWQTVNLGDIAHTPGLLRLLEEHFPAAEIRFWPANIKGPAEPMLRRRFPRIAFVQTEAEVRTAFAECDFLLHGSGPGLVAEAQLERWQRETRKPYGVFGITLSRPLPNGGFVYGVPTERTLAVLGGAAFAFFRDSPSLELARERGCSCPHLAFGPDAAFACDVRDDAAADAFLRRHDLADGRFLCCFSKLRYTPDWLMHPGRTRNEDKHRRNEELKERDHEPLRAAIAAVVRETDHRILLCPEDTSEMEIGRTLLLERLPADVRRRVVWRPDFWLTDEALSTFVRSAGLFGHEQHSPIMAIGHGIPALVGRWMEQTPKGIMWRDVGLGDWLFDFDQPETLDRLTPTVLSLIRDPAAAKAKAAAARDRVRALHRGMVDTLRAQFA